MAPVAAIDTGGADDPRRSTLIAFGAKWCAPCRALAHVLVDVAADFAAEIVVRKVDVEAEPTMKEQFAVTTLPTVVLCRDGQEVARAVGGQSRSRLTALIEAHL